MIDEKNHLERIITSQYRKRFFPAETADNFTSEFAESPPEDALFKEANNHYVHHNQEELLFVNLFNNKMSSTHINVKRHRESSLSHRKPKKLDVFSRLYVRSSIRMNSKVDSSKNIEDVSFSSRRGSTVKNMLSQGEINENYTKSILDFFSHRSQAGIENENSKSDMKNEENIIRNKLNVNTKRNILRHPPKSHRIRSNLSNAIPPMEIRSKFTEKSKRGFGEDSLNDITKDPASSLNISKEREIIDFKKGRGVDTRGNKSYRLRKMDQSEATPEKSPKEEYTLNKFIDGQVGKYFPDYITQRDCKSLDSILKERAETFLREKKEKRSSEVEKLGFKISRMNRVPRFNDAIISEIDMFEVSERIKTQHILNQQRKIKEKDKKKHKVVGFAHLLGDYAKNKQVKFMKLRRMNQHSGKLTIPNKWVEVVLGHPEVFKMKKYVAYRKSLVIGNRSQNAQLVKLDTPQIIDQVKKWVFKKSAMRLKDEANDV